MKEYITKKMVEDGLMSKVIIPELENDDVITSHDSSTNGLINAYKKLK